MATHFVFFPFPAQGHLIPTLDLVRMIAKQGVLVTIFLTPQNANTLKSIIDRAILSGLRINIVHLKFAPAELGLPEGCQYFDEASLEGLAADVYGAVANLREQVEDLLQNLPTKPSCLIADMNFSWPSNTKLQIPRLTFIATCCFSLLHPNMLAISRVPNIEALVNCDDEEYFKIPDGMPEPFNKLLNDMYQSEKEGFGTVVNTTEELEAESVEKYFKLRGKKIWCVGPLALFNKDNLAERGIKASIDQNQCLKWLDSHQPGSVIYVCFGSQGYKSPSKLIELGLGLESSNRPFIWVLRNPPDEVKTWMLEGKFEERVRGRGLLIHDWAPQVLILSHPSVGGFMTHCGWNSTVEAYTAGLPMITWPSVVDHFCIEEYIVNGLKIGIRLGGDEEGEVQVKRADVKFVIDKLMDGGEEGRERRERARKVSKIAKGAVEEKGSSYNNIIQLIQEINKLQARDN